MNFGRMIEKEFTHYSLENDFDFFSSEKKLDICRAEIEVSLE
jgi:hypothetical protein